MHPRVLTLLPILWAGVALAAEAKSPLSEDIRWVFVGFLYAFVISEIAKQCAEVFSSRRQEAGFTIARLLHLLLATIVVLTSWLGWSLAVSGSTYPPLIHVLQPGTLIFLVEVWLLVSYQILVSGMAASRPSVNHVLGWMAAIYGGYFAWDVLVALMSSRAGSWEHAFISGTWTLIATLAYLGLRRRETTRNALSICVADAALLSLVLAFRFIKVGLPLPVEGDAVAPEVAVYLELTQISLALFLLLAAAVQLVDEGARSAAQSAVRHDGEREAPVADPGLSAKLCR